MDREVVSALVGAVLLSEAGALALVAEKLALVAEKLVMPGARSA